MKNSRRLDLKIPPIFIWGLAAALMFILGMALPGMGLARIFRVLTFCALQGLCFALILAAALGFRRAKTTLDPRYPEQSTQLLQSGVFSFSRNPIYLAMLVSLVGWGILIDSLFALGIGLLFVVYMNRYQIQIEERHLAQRFGINFERYCQKVRRWV